MSTKSKVPTLVLGSKQKGATGRTLRRRRGRLRDALLSWLFLVLIIASWELTSRFWIDPLWISSPWSVAERLGSSVADGTLGTNTWVTLEETIIGLILGIIAGVVCGLILAHARLVAKLLDPYILGLYSLPRIALAPFFVLWLGIGLMSKVVLVVSVVFFVVLFNVRQGIETVDNDLMDALRSMQASKWQMTRQVVIPTVTPWIMSAVKIGVGLALVSAVVGEMVGSTEGLGWYIIRSLNQFDMAGAILALLVMGVVAMLLFYLLAWIERRLFSWRGDGSGSVTVQM